MYIVAIDNGYDSTKVQSPDKQFSFKSRIQTTDEDFSKGTVVEYKDQKYIVGAGKDSIEIDKTKNETHKICTLTALAKLTESNSEEYKIVLALPMNHFRNRMFREEFKDYIMSEKINTIRLNEQKKSIVIHDCLVFMQGASALYANQADHKGKIVGLIDLGGLTLNAAIFEDMKIVPESIVTINAGMVVIENKIKTAINEKLKWNLQDYEIPYLFSSPKQEIQVIISEVLQEHIEGIKRELRAKNWSLESLDMIGTGGGMFKTKDIIQKYFNIKISPNCIYDNAKGLYNVGRAYWK